MTQQICRASAKFRYGMSSLEQLEDWLGKNFHVPSVAFIGRSNVGKSSVINALYGKKTAKTSKTPGRTREINIFEFHLEKDGKPQEEQKFYLFDLPGYGYAKVSKDMQKHWNELMDTFFSMTGKETLMVNLQDARHPGQKSDLEFVKYLKQFQFPAVLVFNKFDKLKKQKDRAVLQKQIKKIKEKSVLFSQFLKVSAESKDGLSNLEKSIIHHLLQNQP